MKLLGYLMIHLPWQICFANSMSRYKTKTVNLDSRKLNLYSQINTQVFKPLVIRLRNLHYCKRLRQTKSHLNLIQMNLLHQLNMKQIQITHQFYKLVKQNRAKEVLTQVSYGLLSNQMNKSQHQCSKLKQKLRNNQCLHLKHKFRGYENNFSSQSTSQN